MRTCKTCKHLIYPTIMGYACKKRGLWGTDIPLFFDGFECKKWKLTNRKDDVNGFVPVEPMKAGHISDRASIVGLIHDLKKLM